MATADPAPAGAAAPALLGHVVEDVRVRAGPAVLAAVQAEHPDVREVADADAMVAMPIDVYAPCALGRALDDAVVEKLTAKIVCGAANNQLAHEGIEKMLQDRGVLYAPDYMVNAGGLIQVADELEARGGRVLGRSRQSVEEQGSGSGSGPASKHRIARMVVEWHS